MPRLFFVGRSFHPRVPHDVLGSLELMRYESIETTLRFDAGTDAQRTAEAAWAAYEQAAWKSKPAKALPANGAAGTRTQDQRIKSPDEPEG